MEQKEKQKRINDKADAYGRYVGRKVAIPLFLTIIVFGTPIITRFIWPSLTYWKAFRLHMLFYWLTFIVAIGRSGITYYLSDRKKDTRKATELRIIKRKDEDGI